MTISYSPSLAALTAPLLLAGCAGLAAVNPGQLSGAASGLFGIPAATVSAQVVQELVEIQSIAAQLQMLKAQLNGTPVVLPTIPSPVVVNPSPTPVTPVPPPVGATPAPAPTLPGPVVTPSLRPQKRRGAMSEQIATTAMLNSWQLP